MRTVAADRSIPATVAEAEAAWFDTRRWPHWVDGLDDVVEVTAGWPDPGGAVTWRSNPAGRGTVTETVIAREPLRSQTVRVADDQILGEQEVQFEPEPPGTAVTLTLRYEIRRRSPIITPLIDLLFVRRAMALSLERTLTRFAANLRS